MNVQDQRHDAGSLLSFFQRLIRSRREAPELGWGSWQVVDSDSPGVLVHRCDWQDGTVVAIHNLRGEPVTVRPELDLRGCHQEDLLGDRVYEPLSTRRPAVQMDPYGYRWIRLRRPSDPREPTTAERV